MIAATLVTKVVWSILGKYENRFAIFSFLWSVFVVSRRRRNETWEEKAIGICDIIRCISIPLFHHKPIEWIFIFTTSSVFSFLLQRKEFTGVVLMLVLQLVLYFLLLGLSPMTYWNFGKQFFNLVVWPDDPQQLAIEMGMSVALCLMAVHFLMAAAERALSFVRIDWLSVVFLAHPVVTYYLFPSHYNLSLLAVWFSLFLITVKYQRAKVELLLGALFMYFYMKCLTIKS